MSLKNTTIPSQKDRTLLLDSNKELDGEIIKEFIYKHQKLCAFYKELEHLYTGNHDIFHQKKKPLGKPDNRIGINFARYVVDTAVGFFVGNPIKFTHENELIKTKIDDFRKRNYEEDNDAEIAKLASIYGLGYKLLYQDEDGETRSAVISPNEGFLVYSNDLKRKPIFGFIYTNVYDDSAKTRFDGLVYTDKQIYEYRDSEKTLLETEKSKEYEQDYYFNDVPLIEYVENEEKQGRIELIWSLVNTYNKMISEKANDVDYFADAYLKLIGVDLKKRKVTTEEGKEVEETDVTREIRDKRIIASSKPLQAGQSTDIAFLEKPNADSTQENSLNRLERLIYQMSMTYNSNDETLISNASGKALGFKLQDMKNSTLTKERKFKKANSLEYKMVLQTDPAITDKKAWMDIEQKYTYSEPRDPKEEADTARALAGVTSKETQLSVLSVVPDVNQELKRLEKEEESVAEKSVPLDEFNRPEGQKEGIIHDD